MCESLPNIGLVRLSTCTQVAAGREVLLGKEDLPKFMLACGWIVGTGDVGSDWGNRSTMDKGDCSVLVGTHLPVANRTESQKLPKLHHEKPFPSFAGLLDFSANGILPNPRQVPCDGDVEAARSC